MLKNRFFLISLFLLLAGLFYYTFLDNNTITSADNLLQDVNPQTYKRQLNDDRLKKDQFFRTNAESPFTDKKRFNGLVYFTPDPSYRVVARLEPFVDKTQKLVVRMSNGDEEVYDKFAHAIFKLQGETCRLLIVKLENTYSILFRDATSNKASYGGGRYLELNPAELTNTQAVLDFNKAYNPYCAYNPGYSCPLPPAENTLPVAVNAGEKYVAHE